VLGKGEGTAKEKSAHVFNCGAPHYSIPQLLQSWKVLLAIHTILEKFS